MAEATEAVDSTDYIDKTCIDFTGRKANFVLSIINVYFVSEVKKSTY